MIISFVMGLGGLRYLLIFHIPAVCAGTVLLVWRKEFYDFLSSPTREKVQRILVSYEARRAAVIISGGIMAAAGYIVLDKWLRHRYIFQKFGDLTYKNLGENGESILNDLGKAIMGIPEIMGFKYNVPLMSTQGFINMFILLLVLVTFICLSNRIRKVFIGVDRLDTLGGRDYTSDFILLMSAFSFLANLFIFVFVGNYTSRYWIVVLIWLIPLLAVYISGVNRPSNLLRLGTLIVIVYALINGTGVLNDAIKHNNSANRYAVNQYLMDKNIDVGYSTFWNANVTTEMTNGKIKILPINSESDLTIYRWLTPRDFYYDDRQKYESAFILLSRQEAEQIYDTPVYRQAKIGYIDDSYVVYIFNREYLESVILY